MLQPVPVEPKALRDYTPIVGEDDVQEIKQLAATMRGARVLHVSATAFGGGVAEILYSLVPLMRDVGLNAEWRIIYGTDPFFKVTKGFHNALQGAAGPVSDEARRIYTEITQLNAQAFKGDYDFVVLHDPQPAGILSFVDRGLSRHWIWRCHIDTSQPNAETLAFLTPFLTQYETAIFTLPEFVPPTLHFPRCVFIPPTIDPLSPKNQPMTLDEARQIVSQFDVDPTRPLITQVSRFDPWKDPLGVIDAYRMVKVEMPELQLALVGSMASDDPEGWSYYERTVRRAGDDFDIGILHNFHGVGNRQVNAFQTAADVVIQKSLREGFGLVVTEALWKSKAVVAGNAGGIPLQVIDGETGYLVDSSLACADRAYQLLRRPAERQRLGQQGRSHVRENFLLPRLLRDYLRLFQTLDNTGADEQPLASRDYSWRREDKA